MSDYIKKIRTKDGDKQIDYESLANLPSFKTINGESILGSGDIKVETESDENQNVNLSDYAKNSDLAKKQDKLVSGTNIKSINGESILGSGDITLNASSIKGLNVLCLGDSITAGQGMTSSTRWANVLATKLGWNLTVQAQGGIPLSSYYYTANGETDISICKKAESIANMSTKPDLVIVWGGHNDTSYRYSPLGTFDDLETKDTSGVLGTYADRNGFKGALRYIAELVHTYAPKATLVVLTREWTNLTPSKLKVPEGTTDTNRMYDEAIFEGAKYFGWIPINMQLCGITPFTKGTYTGDNVHPNAAGTDLIVKYLESELGKLYYNLETKTISVTGISINKTSTTIVVGGTEQLSAIVSPTDASNKGVIWSSNNTSIASVNNGLVTAKAEGSATITAKTSDGGFSATCTVEVSAKSVSVESVSLDHTSYEMEQSTQMILTATINPSNATNQNLNWESSNEEVLTVKDGVVNALREGEATVTVTTEDGNYKATCTFKVNAMSDYYVLEKANNTTHDSWELSSLLGAQYFVLDGAKSIELLQGKTITEIFIGVNKTFQGTSMTLNLYLVDLDNPLPSAWTLHQTITRQVVASEKWSQAIDELTIPEGYTIGYNATSSTIGTFTKESVGSIALDAHYYDKASATTSSSISLRAIDFKVKA